MNNTHTSNHTDADRASADRDQRGIILSGKDIFKFNQVEVTTAGFKLGDRVTFIARTIRGTEIASDIRVHAGRQSLKAA